MEKLDCLQSLVFGVYTQELTIVLAEGGYVDLQKSTRSISRTATDWCNREQRKAYGATNSQAETTYCRMGKPGNVNTKIFKYLTGEIEERTVRK